MENIYEVAEIKTAETLAMRIRITVRNTQKIMLDAAISIGQDLIDAKELVEHGEWENWLENSVGFSSSSAVKYMKISREYSNISKTELITDLSYTKALKLLAVPEEAREDFMENNDIEDMTVKELEAKIAQMKTEKDSLEQDNQSLKTDLHKATIDVDILARKVTKAEEELSKIETADGLSDEALTELREKQEEIDQLLISLEKKKESEQKLKEKLDKVNVDMESKIQEEIKKASDEAKRIAVKESEEELIKYKNEIGKLINDLANADKKLQAASNDGLTKVKIMLEDIQTNFNKVLDTISTLDDEMSEKMTNYIKAVVNSFNQKLGE